MIVLDAIPALLMPAIILGGIYSGFFTPTEASGVAVFYGLILGVFVYKEIKPKDIKKMFIDAGVMSASAMMVVSLASGFSWIISITRLPRTLSTFLLGVFSNPVLIILMLMVLLLIIGCFMSVSAATVVLTPILVPVMAAMGVSPIVLGITMTVIVSCGMSTPPFAVNLFVASGISKVPIDRMAKYAFILVGITVLMMLIMTFIPGIITFLPRLAGMTV
jgi:C4-dicarboxylate transporter DctM subunit